MQAGDAAAGLVRRRLPGDRRLVLGAAELAATPAERRRRPTPAQAAWELRLSHWTGDPAALTVKFGWSYRRFIQLYGLYSYAGRPVFGYKVRSGVPLDGYGRNIYVDALSSDIGPGWKRVNSFLAHAPVGAFCYGFVAHGGQPVSARSSAPP